jgi:hypothetical protein
LTRGYVTVIDDEDAAIVAGYSWCAWVPKPGYVYAVARIHGMVPQKMISMHRLLLKAPKGMEVDHKDGDGLNNRRSNIRLCTKAQNQHNSLRTWGASRFKGVHRCKKTGKWIASIRRGSRRQYLGKFLSEGEAARAYDASARLFFGEFARCNFQVREGL